MRVGGSAATPPPAAESRGLPEGAALRCPRGALRPLRRGHVAPLASEPRFPQAEAPRGPPLPLRPGRAKGPEAGFWSPTLMFIDLETQAEGGRVNNGIQAGP